MHKNLIEMLIKVQKGCYPEKAGTICIKDL